MTQLIAFLTGNQSTWTSVVKLMQQGDFDEIILFTNEFGKTHFTPKSNTTILAIDPNQPIHSLTDTYMRELRPKVKGTEVVLNMMSGSGHEHMALLSAILKLGMGVRLVVAGEKTFDEV